MKRTIAAAIAVIGLAAVFPAAHASADTTTTTPTVPSQCFLGLAPNGPSRATHQAPGTVAGNFAGPNCSDVDGLCITVNYPDGGGSRTVHGLRPALPAPCVPVDEACDITLQYNDLITGPARAIHQPSVVTNPVSGVVYTIPAPCIDAMVLALTPTGSDTAPMIWIGTAFLGAGAVLIIAPRRLARR